MTSGFVYAVPASSGSGGLSDGDYGDVTVSGSGTAITIDAGVVTKAQMADAAALSVIGRPANSTGVPADISATPASAAVLRESGSTIGWGTVATDGIANDAVTFAKMQDIDGLSVVGNAGTFNATPDEVTSSTADHVLITNGTATGILWGQVAAGGITNNAVTDTKIRDSGALTVIGRSANSTGDPADIAASAASGAVLRESGSTLGFGTIATAGIANDAVTDTKIRNSGACSVIGRSANSTGDPADISAGGDGYALIRDSGALAFHALNTAYTVFSQSFNSGSFYGAAATSPPTLALVAPICSGPTDADNHVAGYGLANNFVTWLQFEFRIPVDVVGGGTDLTPNISIVTNGAPGADTIDIDIIGNVIDDNQTVASTANAFTAGTVIDISGYGASTYVKVDLSALGLSLTPGQIVKGVIQRDATAGNASDTYADTILITGITFTGIRQNYV